jgi:hypothetical protein
LKRELDSRESNEQNTTKDEIYNDYYYGLVLYLDSLFFVVLFVCCCCCCRLVIYEIHIKEIIHKDARYMWFGVVGNEIMRK